MKELFSLGAIYPSDFLKEGEQPSTEKVELKLIMDDEGLVRLENTAPMNKMYGKYWYRSGINSTMRDALKDVVDSILKVQKVCTGDIWLDIACNDGTLLSFVPKDLKRIGIDPTDDSYKMESVKHADRIVQEFFSKEVYNKIASPQKAKVVTSIAMFYDVPNPTQFIKDVYDILEDDGLWVMQLSYSPIMLRQAAFDNICHEHIYYYSLFNLRNILAENGFMITDCELNEVNGGSMRVYIKKAKSVKEIHDTNFFRIQSLILFERETRMDFSDRWTAFFEIIQGLREKLRALIIEAKSEGKNIWAYGASTKGNTLLQYFGLDNTLIDAIAERNPDKYGLRTIGSNILIKSEEEMRQTQPDYLLVLPWHFKNEFIEREKEYLLKGGKMIFPCPTFEIISK